VQRRITVTVDLGIVIVILIGLCAGAATLFIKRGRTVTAQALEQKYGPKRYSEQNEELVIRDVFQDRKFGIFVDVGAGHYLQGSNTYFLEQQLGWRGVAIDPIAEYEAGYREHRPNTIFFPLFVSDRSNQDVDFFFAPNDPTRSSGLLEGTRHAKVVTQRARTVTLNDLLRSNSFTRFDFLSMDIELGEPAALAGLDIRTFRPTLVCIEAHDEVQDAIRKYFADNGYRRLDQYLTVDTRNWYYSPQ
jgi:FkbM family methyltransferase